MKRLEDKFIDLASRVIPKEQASKIAAIVRVLDNLKIFIM